MDHSVTYTDIIVGVGVATTLPMETVDGLQKSSLCILGFYKKSEMSKFL